MRITQLAIQNYKSLRSVSITPGDLNVIVGANGSGKSNFADCLDFVSEVYRHGLEVAVARKGGYENIAYRKQRRSKSAMSLQICVEINPAELRASLWSHRSRSKPPGVRAKHFFSFATRGSSIRAEFAIVAESLEFEVKHEGEWEPVVKVVRKSDGTADMTLLKGAATEPKGQRELMEQRERFLDFPDLKQFLARHPPISPSELLATSIARYTTGMYAFISAVSSIRVYQISPTKSREFGVPTPRPELAGTGENLPAVVDLLRKKHPKEWKSVLQAMRTIVPGLKDISVDYTSNRTLGLFFEEHGFGRPWSVGEVSDGTIQTLALLVAIYDPASTALFLEEPENSVHPWVIRNLIQACREASKRKQILLTTHSPIVMNAVQPREMWVMWRTDGSSHLAPFEELDSSFSKLWAGGEVATFDYLDSGALPHSLPPTPVGDLEAEPE